MLYSDKYLLFKLICYLTCIAHSFYCKIFIIEHSKITLVNIVIDKAVSYRWQYSNTIYILLMKYVREYILSLLRTYERLPIDISYDSSSTISYLG